MKNFRRKKMEKQGAQDHKRKKPMMRLVRGNATTRGMGAGAYQDVLFFYSRNKVLEFEYLNSVLLNARANFCALWKKYKYI